MHFYECLAKNQYISSDHLLMSPADVRLPQESYLTRIIFYLSRLGKVNWPHFRGNAQSTPYICNKILFLLYHLDQLQLSCLQLLFLPTPCHHHLDINNRHHFLKLQTHSYKTLILLPWPDISSLRVIKYSTQN
jgi:hypothetical protein